MLALGSMLLSIATIISPARSDVLIAQNNPAPNVDLKIPPGGVGKLVKELNLSPEQVQRLQKLRADSHGKNKERRQALLAAKQDLSQLLGSNAPADQIRQKRQQVQSLQREIADTNFENTLAIREILKPEQRVKLQQLMEQRRRDRD
jgi:periplasmic protein CpxP/Spy